MKIDKQADLVPKKDNKRFQAVLCACVEGGYDTASIIGLESSGRLTVFCGLNTEPTCWESCLRVKLSTGLCYFPCTIIAGLLVYFVHWKNEKWQH